MTPARLSALAASSRRSAATFELPAAAFLAALGVPLLMARTRPTLLFFLPGAVVPIIASFACNYAALGQLPCPPTASSAGRGTTSRGATGSSAARRSAKGIDFNHEPTTVYAFHLLLRPPRLVQPHAGVVAGARRLDRAGHSQRGGCPEGVRARPAARAGRPSVRGDDTRGLGDRIRVLPDAHAELQLRRLHQRSALAVLAHPALGAGDPAGRGLAGRLMAGRLLGQYCLAFSVFSVFYPARNPWRHPWILNLMEFTGFLRY